MPLSPGDKLGPYEILAPIGSGGMGTVYRARDPRLNRNVAIKTSAEQFTERFDREARAIAALNHPHICQIYDVGPDYLVMELIDGQPLNGPLPLDLTLKYGAQICDALDAAHRKGIAHRDLKPANILVTRHGIKLLDFGLAKTATGPLKPGNSPDDIVTKVLTGKTEIVGTLHYMSPEQLHGQCGEVDVRTDIFSFGLLLYEMLTGRRAFDGPSPASVIAAIIERPAPSISSVAPRALDRVFERCLAKDPDDRWQTARDLRQELVWLQEGGSQAGAPAVAGVRRKPHARIAWAAAGAFAVTAIVLAALLLRQEKPVPRPVRFTINAPEGTGLYLVGQPVISPDGENILFGAGGGQLQMYLHSLATGATRALTGTEGATGAYWSFDSRSFMVLRDGGLARLDLNGGQLQSLQLPFPAASSAWGPQGIFAAGGGILRWFQPDGSGLRQVRAPGPKEPGGLAYPSLVPDSQWLLYNARVAVGITTSPSFIHLMTVDGQTDRTLFTADSAAIYGAPGYILYLRGSVLMARPLDPKTGKLGGDAVPLVEGVAPGIGGNIGAFTVSGNGVLVYRPGNGAADAHLVWFDRAGKNLGTVGSAADYSGPALSPEGSRLAVGIRDPAAQARDIWVLDLARGAATKLTFDPKDDFNPVWSPDGSRIAFSSDRRGARDLYIKSASGTGEEELLLETDRNKNAEDWSRDGRSFAYNEAVPGANNDIWTLSFDARKPQPFLQTRFNEDEAKFSPDGKWIAYRSAESGRSEVYVQPFAASASGSRGKWVVSNAGGLEPQWRGDGKELFYTSLETPAKVMAVDIEAKNDAILAGRPHPLFETRLPTGGRNRWVVTRDGKKFLAVVPIEQKPATTLNVILNWPSLLRKQ